MLRLDRLRHQVALAVADGLGLPRGARGEDELGDITRGEAGEIRDAATATRRTLGLTRAREFQASAAALGVATAECLDLGDGNLANLPFTDVVTQVRAVASGSL